MTKKVGITCGCEPGTIVDGWPLIYTNDGLVQAVADAGAIPVLLPVLDKQELLSAYIDLIDGLIVSGETLNISRNVIEDGKKNVLYNSNSRRYTFELTAIHLALKKNLPVLGICRGFQMLNVVEGGTMHDTDITRQNHVLHQQGGIYPPDIGVHEIAITPGSKLHKLVGTDTIQVNSFHRQAVKTIPKGYLVAATAPDGTIEGIELGDERFVMGVQFHPEMLQHHMWSCFFERFVSSCD